MEISSIYLKAFYQLAKDRNFTKAAGHLAITQSAFSHRILNLERELETTLVIREKGNVQLTDAGETLLRYCQKVDKLQEEVLESLYDANPADLVGSVRIAGFSSITRSCLIPALTPLLRDSPRVTASVLSAEIDELLPMLKSSQVDFIVSNRVPQNNNIEALFLGYEENVLVESNTHKFNGYYLDHDAKDVTTSSYFRLKPELEKKGIKKRYLDEVYGLLDGVRMGLGRAILPSHLIESQRELKILFPKTKLRVPLYLLFYKNTYQTQLEKSVIASVKEYFASRFSQK